LKTLIDAGVDPERLELNVVSRNKSTPYRTEIYMVHNHGPKFSLPHNARRLVPVVDEPVRIGKRRLTVRLHFAELDRLKPGRRVFDVSVQGTPVLTAFDLARAAPGPCRAVVREFKGVQADRDLTIELAKSARSADEPIICAIEVLDSSPQHR